MSWRRRTASFGWGASNSHREDAGQRLGREPAEKRVVRAWPVTGQGGFSRTATNRCNRGWSPRRTAGRLAGQVEAIPAEDIQPESDGDPVPAVDRHDGERRGRGLLGREHGAHSGENLLRRPGPHVTFHLSWHQDQRWAVAPREVFSRYGTGFSSSLAPVTWAGRSRAAELSLGDGRADGTARARAGSGGVGDAAEHRAVGGVESRQRAASAAPTAAMCASIAARSWSALAISAALSGGPGWRRRRRVRFDGQTEQAG
jgi:hypothetical protein